MGTKTEIRRSLLSTIWNGLSRIPECVDERPNRIWIGDPTKKGSALTTSLSGLAYLIVSEAEMKGMVLKVNREIVAKNRLEMMLWLAQNAPRTLKEAVRLLIKYEKGE